MRKSTYYVLCRSNNVFQAKDLLERKDRRGRSVLGMAARGGSGELFQQALKVIEELYTDGEVRTVYNLSAMKPFKIFLLESIS